MSKRISVLAIAFAILCGNAMAQDAKTVIANAQKALGDVKSVTYTGSAKDVSFQQCGANSTDMQCRGIHDPMRPITNYVRVIDLTAPAVSTPMGSPSATTMVISAPAGRALRRLVRPQVGGLDRTRAPARDFHRRDAAPEPRP